MKRRLIIPVGAGLAFLLPLLCLFAVFTVVRLGGQKAVPDLTPEKVSELFTAAGGIDKINQEAGQLLSQPRSKGQFFFLYDRDLTQAPALAALYSLCENYSGTVYTGTSMANIPDAPESARHLEIKFGNHWVLKRIYIYDPNSLTIFPTQPGCFQMTSNIFVTQ